MDTANATMAHALPRPQAGALAVGIAFCIAALAWSPLVPALTGIPFTVALLAGFVAFAAATSSLWRADEVAVSCTLAMLAVSAAMMALSQSAILLTRTAPIVLLAFIAWQGTRIPGFAIRFCNALTVFLQIGVAGAIVGQVYAYAGGAPLLTITNIDGRENALYLTTMSNFNWLGVIRPAFIYDEPGAFSFMLCAAVALRELLGLRRGPSSFLLVGGIFTFSLTHWIVTLLYFVVRFGIVRVSLVVALLVVPVVPVLSSMEELSFVFDRFSVVDGGISGDNRSNQLKNFSAVVDGEMVLFGDVECQGRPDKVCEEHGDITSSPATPTYKGGILALLAQLGVHATLAVAFIRRPRFRFSAATMTILLLQRPYFEIAGYGSMTYLVVFLMMQHMNRRASPRQAEPGVPAPSHDGAQAR